MRRELAAAAFRLTAGYDATDRGLTAVARAGGSASRCPAELSLDAGPGADSCATARTRTSRPRSIRVSGVELAPGPFCEWRRSSSRASRSRTTTSSTPSAAAGLARDLRGAACVIVKHANPCGAAEAADPLDGLGARPRRRSGQCLRRRRGGDAAHRRGTRRSACSHLSRGRRGAGRRAGRARDPGPTSRTCASCSIRASARRRWQGWSSAAPAARSCHGG